jgi:hypothetical protein
MWDENEASYKVGKEMRGRQRCYGFLNTTSITRKLREERGEERCLC